MSIFCGIVNLSKKQQLSQSWVQTFRREITRTGLGHVDEYLDAKCHLIKLSVGAMKGSGWLESKNRVAVMAGDPLLCSEKFTSDRDKDLLRIANSSDLHGDETQNTLLRKARGNFAFAVYDKQNGHIRLGTDKLGLRALYWLRTGDCLVFSSALRILSANPDNRLEPHIEGLFERLAFGFPLRDRTVFKSIKILEGGETLSIINEKLKKCRYWNWIADCGDIQEESPYLRKNLYNCFLESIAIRSEFTSPVYAALSGGLDSRCVVCGLIEAGRDVRTLNVSWPGSLDQTIGRDMAEKLGTVHLEKELMDWETGEKFLPYSFSLMREDWEFDVRECISSRQIWGGNDGSISVGFVYVTPQCVSLLRDGDIASAAREFLQQKSISINKKIFSSEYAALSQKIPLESVIKYLSENITEDPGQSIFTFLLLTYQRRMMHEGLEDIDLLPLESVEPFFDTEFLKLTCQLPIDSCIGHGFYHRWLREFPDVVMSCPWQVYPGHEECWLQMPTQSKTQWNYYSEHVSPALKKLTIYRFNEMMMKEHIVPYILNWRRLKMIGPARSLRLIDGFSAMSQAIKVYDIFEQMHLR